MEWCHKEKLRKLKADHDQLKARVKRPQGDEHSAHTFPERTQGESHLRCTVNTPCDLCLSHIHCPARKTTRRHPFVDHIMEADIPLGCKPLNLKQYDVATDPNKHLDAFLTQANLYTNDDSILCCVFPTSLKRATLTWYDGLPPRCIDSFDTLVEWFNV